MHRYEWWNILKSACAAAWAGQRHDDCHKSCSRRKLSEVASRRLARLQLTRRSRVAGQIPLRSRLKSFLLPWVRSERAGGWEAAPFARHVLLSVLQSRVRMQNDPDRSILFWEFRAEQWTSLRAGSRRPLPRRCCSSRARGRCCARRRCCSSALSARTRLHEMLINYEISSAAIALVAAAAHCPWRCCSTCVPASSDLMVDTRMRECDVDGFACRWLRM